MAILSRCLGANSPSHAATVVCPASDITSVAILEDRKGSLVLRQSLQVRESRIGGPDIFWTTEEELTGEQLRLNKLAQECVALADNSTLAPKDLFRLNEPEIWVHGKAGHEWELWAPLMIEAAISGIGLPRMWFYRSLNSLAYGAFKMSLVKAYAFFDHKIENLTGELDGQGRDSLRRIAKAVSENPHKTLGISYETTKAMTPTDRKLFMGCRPLWSTDADQLGSLLQKTPFAVGRRSGKCFLNQNASWAAAENIGYAQPCISSIQKQRKPSAILAEVKPVSSLVATA